MSDTAMILHRGARVVSIDDVARVATPEPTASWFPIPHVDVLETVEATLAATAFTVRSRSLALSASGNQFFATLDLFAPVGPGVSLSVGVRNSVDKTLPLGFCAGNRVFVCDNLSFSAELLVNRKHTAHGGARFHEAIAHAAGRLEAFQMSEAARVGQMRTIALDDQTAESLILRAWESKVISHRQLPAVLAEWRAPSHDDFGPRTRWSLFNAFTEALKPLGVSNPQAFAGRTFRLNALLVPPNEGPADIQAAFEAVAVETDRGEAAPEASALDAFWADYEATL